MSIASAITAAQNKVAAAYTSCNNMGATMPASADQNLSHLPATIESIPQGSSNPEAGENDVIFIDYDGTIRYSYSKADFANLTALPANPTHTGLTAQGWNWTLADAQSYVATYGGLVIGQMYVTDDGKTRLYISIANPGRMDVPLHFYQDNANGVEIDWGDGSATEMASGSGDVAKTHTYSSVGDYMITLKSNNGPYRFGGGSNNTLIGYNTNAGRVYLNMLQKIEMGTNVSTIRMNALYNAFNLRSITMTNSVATLGNNALYQCGLSSIVIPKTISSLSNTLNSNMSFRLISFPKEVTNLGNGWAQYVYPLQRFSIPPSITTVGDYAFYNCYSLASITIPSSVTAINLQAFYNCYGLKELRLYPTTPPSITSNALTNTPADMVIYVPNGKLATYQGASNWSAYSSQMVEMPA